MIGLAAIAMGITGVFMNLLYGEGYMAALGIGVSLGNITLGLILFLWGARSTWS
jgi:hypothetical protein